MITVKRLREVNGKRCWVNVELSPEEEAQLEALQEAEPIPQPTGQDRLEAQVLYTALMTDTLIEEE